MRLPAMRAWTLVIGCALGACSTTQPGDQASTGSNSGGSDSGATADAGRGDAGEPLGADGGDAGAQSKVSDAGDFDAGLDAGGRTDSGTGVPTDAGALDSGVFGAVDGGGTADAGEDAGDAPDSGTLDAGETNLCQATPTGWVSLPADDAQHGALLEWWYWTGHLETADGGEYGFEQTFFRTSDLGAAGQLVNVALTDVGGQKFRYGSGVGFGPYPQINDGFTLAVAGQYADGGDGHDWLYGAPEDAFFDLTLNATKAPVLQGDAGYIGYSNGDWTGYYSRERLAIAGTLSVNGQNLPVTGEGWFDHQWGALQQEVTGGWEWFSLQLDDGRTLMINWPLVNGVPTNPSGSISDADCHVTPIGANDVTLSALGSWVSPHTLCTYPMGWQVSYRGSTFTILPDMTDQELSGTGVPTYWEGASTVSGDATGKAYVELNGFCSVP